MGIDRPSLGIPGNSSRNLLILDGLQQNSNRLHIFVHFGIDSKQNLYTTCCGGVHPTVLSIKKKKKNVHFEN